MWWWYRLVDAAAARADLPSTVGCFCQSLTDLRQRSVEVSARVPARYRTLTSIVLLFFPTHLSVLRLSRLFSSLSAARRSCVVRLSLRVLVSSASSLGGLALSYSGVKRLLVLGISARDSVKFKFSRASGGSHDAVSFLWCGVLYVCVALLLAVLCGRASQRV